MAEKRNILDPIGSGKVINLISEALKAEIDTDPIKFPKELGEQHPFNLETADKFYAKNGGAKAAVDKHLDFIISPGFHVTSKVKKAEVLIRDLIEQPGFRSNIRKWIKEALGKGNGYLEFSVDRDGVDSKNVNANNMYVVRNNKGKLLGYNQYMGKMGTFNPKKIIPFKPNEIAHLKIDPVGDSAYGIGILYPAMVALEYRAKAVKSMHVMLDRKANAPYVFNAGTEKEPATQGDITALGQKLEYLNNMQEWVLDHKTQVKALEFGNIGDKFASVLEMDAEDICNVFQIPAVIFGKANVPEGLAKVQLDTFERRIQSIQAEIEAIVEEQIFKPFLNANGFDAHVEIEWNLPSEESVNGRINMLAGLLNNQTLDPAFKAQIQIDIAQQLNYEDAVKYMQTPKEAEIESEENKKMMKDAQDREREEEESIKQPEIPGEKKTSSEMLEFWDWKEEQEKDYTIKEWINLKELAGFNYSDYLKAIIEAVKNDKFKDLKALTESQEIQGLLSEKEIDSLRKIMKTSFEKNYTIKQIEDNIRNTIPLKDRLNEDGALVMTAEVRPNMIARTETVRLANEGLMMLWKDNKIEKYRFMAAISDRTCPICMGLDGRIFNVSEAVRGVNQPDIHPNCRCTTSAVVT